MYLLSDSSLVYTLSELAFEFKTSYISDKLESSDNNSSNSNNLSKSSCETVVILPSKVYILPLRVCKSDIVA